ncbi:MAG: AI-2E family transporter [Bacteroidetes bacterium]|nr:AI-2E family transporter [Bacteroidota bacterium]
MTQISLSRTVQILLFFFLLFGGLYIAKAFLVPVTFGLLLAMLMMPLCRRIERMGLHRASAAFICILLLAAFVSGVAAILSWQLSGIAQDFSNIEGQVVKLVDNAEAYISNTIGIAPRQQEELLKAQQEKISGNAGNQLIWVAGSVASTLGSLLLTVVYIFLFIFYRGHLKAFITKLVSPAHRKQAEHIMQNSAKVAEQYISGLGLMIISLWVMYGIGFSIIGVRHALFFAVLCGILEIIPYVGNITGTAITVLMAFTQGGSMSMVIGVIVTYAAVQTFQTYVLEPLVVGSRVNINPMFTIMCIIAGEMVWGVPGMILAIPLMGIVKIILDNIEPLQPFGFLVGSPKSGKKKD